MAIEGLIWSAVVGETESANEGTSKKVGPSPTTVKIRRAGIPILRTDSLPRAFSKEVRLAKEISVSSRDYYKR